jgi:transposase
VREGVQVPPDQGPLGVLLPVLWAPRLPTAGTIFHKAIINLQSWFYAIYLMSSARCGISAKQLEREIGVTYRLSAACSRRSASALGKTTSISSEEASRSIRRGTEASLGLWRMRRETSHYRPTILGVVGHGGRVRAEVIIEGRGGPTIEVTMSEHVLPSSLPCTDAYAVSVQAGKRYVSHSRIKHKGA